MKHFNSVDEPCCDDLHLRLKYRRYHRFFIFSPLFILSILTLLYFGSKGEIPVDAYKYLTVFLILFLLKEIVSFIVSRRIYDRILRPVEDLKRGFYEVSLGNYDVQIQPGMAPEISELIFAFNQMSLQLKDSELEKRKSEVEKRNYEENRKELIASISHDLKTPITSINGFVDGILEGVADSPEKREAYIKIIQQNARYLNRLIDDLLLYSKLDLHKLSFECVQISINDYCTELFQELELEHEENGIQMTFNNKLNQPVSLDMDTKLMTRAIRNIVSNAVTYGKKENAQIDFYLYSSPDGSTVSLEICDNGPGIEKEQLLHIFDRFYRGNNARTASTGSSGLGLAIAKEIVQAHQGKIRGRSESGKGTCIGIDFSLVSNLSDYKEGYV